MHARISQSPTYRAASRRLVPGAPLWVVPFSCTTTADVDRIVAAGCQAGETMVDIGCGSGSIGLWIAERLRASLIGVDFAPSAIAAAHKLGAEQATVPFEFVVAPAETTGLADGVAAFVVSLDVLMFVDAAAALAEIARILQPGGSAAIALSEWTAPSDPPISTVLRDYRPAFAAAGLEVRERREASPADALPLFRSLVANEMNLERELGPVAESLLGEARGHIAGQAAPTTRRVFYLADRP